jgi:hypothetical protein
VPGAKVLAATWVAGWLVVEAYTWLVWLVGLGGLKETAANLAAVATILVSVGAIGVALRRGWRQVKRIGQAITTVLGLDEKLDQHRDESRLAWQRMEERQESLEERTERLERTLAVYGETAAAEVRGALKAVATPVAPRPARATDPDPADERVFFRE